jgi:uncharacterized protein YdeI (BOF family)
MKKLSIIGSLAASALLCGVAAVTPVAAQDATQQSPAQQPTATSPQAQPDPQTQAPTQTPDQAQAGQMQQATKVFTGKISKDGDRLVLKDASTNMTYQLDDQAKAKKFEGKSVKVNGSFDANSNTIHVDSIEAGS